MRSVSVVFHIDINDESRLKMAVENMKNLLKEVDADQSFVSIVANGSSVSLFLKENIALLLEDIKNLHSIGVKFFVCNNSINKFNLDRTSLISEAEIVSAGVLKLIELQSEEKCAYIKP